MRPQWIGILLLALGSVLTFSLPARAAEKSPVIAGLMSAVIPGAGQIYSNRTPQGLAFMGGEALLLAGTFASEIGDFNLFQPSHTSARTSAIYDSLILVHAWNILDAVHGASDHPQKGTPSPAAALSRALSLIGPEDFSSRLHLGMALHRGKSIPSGFRLSYGFTF